MKTTVSVYDFRNAFQQLRPNSFSYEGLTWLYDYFEECEKSDNVEIELDVIGICCDFSESTFDEIVDSYGVEIDVNDSKEDQQKQILDFLSDETIIIDYDDQKIVYKQF
jgi:hypothetical protein